MKRYKYTNMIFSREPDIEWVKYTDHEAEVKKLKEENREMLGELKFARIFIQTRQKMHPIGQKLYDEIIEKVEGE